MSDTQEHSVDASASADVTDDKEPRHNWTREEAEVLFALPFDDLIFRAQTAHRQWFDPNEVQKSTLLSIKIGGCPEDCGYCSQSAKFETGIKATKLMDVDAALEGARRANIHHRGTGTTWKGVLVRTGVYKEGDETNSAAVVVDGVREAVDWILAQEAAADGPAAKKAKK